MKKTGFPSFIFALILLFVLAIIASARTDDVKHTNMLRFTRAYPQKALLNFSVNIFFGYQSEIKRNVEHGTFYLLDKDILEILKDLKLDPTSADGEEIKGADEKEAYLEAAVRVLQTGTKKKGLSDFFEFEAEERSKNHDIDEDNLNSILIRVLLEAKLQKHAVKTFDVDRFSSDVISSQKSGDYFIFGFGKLGGELFIWSEPMKLNAGENTFEFDQYNAEVASDW